MAVMLLCYFVLWQMLMSYLLVEDVKTTKAICFVADVIATVADVITTAGRC